MASIRIVAERRAHALQDLEKVTGKISEQLGIEPLSTKTNNRDAALAEVERIEGVVNYLQAIVEKSQEVQQAWGLHLCCIFFLNCA